MNKIEICHFCGTDYTNDQDTYLLAGPTNEVRICEACVKKADTAMLLQYDAIIRNRRCNMCGITKESQFYGDSPFICKDCLLITTNLIDLANFGMDYG